MEPYLEKRSAFTWLPQSDTEYCASAMAHADVKLTQQRRDLLHIPDYLLWSIGNFILFFFLGIVCIILSVRVREHRLTQDYESTLKLSRRTFLANTITSIAGFVIIGALSILLINKSSSNF